MNLMNSFNFKYFKENIKKSQGLLAFFFGVIPLLNILTLLVATINTSRETILMDFSSISIVTFLGVFIIPLSLACLLYGFVFKRKSVDFVLSKPLNRKTIYFTNLLGGSILIFLLIFLNSLIFFFFNLTTTLVIPLALIIDYFLFWFISYIFMFTVCVLAISLAGNFMTSLVLILLLIYLIPFLSVSNSFLGGYNIHSYIKCTESTCKPDSYKCPDKENCSKEENLYYTYYYKSLSKNYTAPVMLINNDNDGLVYNNISILKMVILSLIYIILSYIFFKNRQMENNETSFKSDILHYIVKGLTLIPVCFITYLILREEPISGFIISLAVVIIYSIIYDLITRKEIYKFLKSSFIALIILGILSGLFTLIENTKKETILDAKDIDYLVYSYANDPITIKDKDLIYRLIKESLEFKQTSSIYTSMQLHSKNHDYNINLTVSSELIDTIHELGLKEKTEELKSFNFNSIDGAQDLKLDKKLKTLIKETYQKNPVKYTEQDYLLTIYNYQNHHYLEINIPRNLNKDLDNYILETKTKKALNMIKNSDYISFETNDLSSEDIYVFQYVLNKNLSNFTKYLENNNNRYTSDFMTIIIYNQSNSMILDIGDAQNFKKEFNKYKNNLKNDFEYNQMLKSITEIEETNVN